MMELSQKRPRNVLGHMVVYAPKDRSTRYEQENWCFHGTSFLNLFSAFVVLQIKGATGFLPWKPLSYTQCTVNLEASVRLCLSRREIMYIYASK